MTEKTMDTIELEMQKAKEAFDRKMARLKQRQVAEEKKLDAKTIEVLKAEHTGVWDTARSKAEKLMANERAERSQKARDARASDTATGAGPVDDAGVRHLHPA